MVFFRSGELQHAERREINFDTETWGIAAERMKMNRLHVVRLSRKDVEILKELYPQTGRGRFLFLTLLTKQTAKSDNTILNGLRHIGINKNEIIFGYGFREMAGIILDKVLHLHPDYIEHH